LLGCSGTVLVLMHWRRRLSLCFPVPG